MYLLQYSGFKCYLHYEVEYNQVQKTPFTTCIRRIIIWQTVAPTHPKVLNDYSKYEVIVWIFKVKDILRNSNLSLHLSPQCVTDVITAAEENRNNAWLPRLFLHVNVKLMKFFFFFWILSVSTLTASGCCCLPPLIKEVDVRRLAVQL